MGLNYHASSPALVLTPNQEHQSYPFGNNYLDHNASQSLTDPKSSKEDQNTAMMDVLASTEPLSGAAAVARQSSLRKCIRPRFPRPPSINYLAKTDSLASGRKRSFADAVEDLSEPGADGSQISPVVTTSTSKPRGEPVYGPGMTLIYPDDSNFAIAAESQTGTWAEENHDRTESEAAEIASRPPVASRKSQRIAAPDSASIEPPVSLSSNMSNGLTDGSPSPSSSDLPVDALTLALGIGWRRISPSLAPATKGWEKYIANHYRNISEPVILLHSESHHAYLVRSSSSTSATQECWWVFQEDLSVCRLVGLCESDAIRGLQKNEMMGPAIEAAKEPSCASQSDLHAPSSLQNAQTTTWTTQELSTSTIVPIAHTNVRGDVEMEM